VFLPGFTAQRNEFHIGLLSLSAMSYASVYFSSCKDRQAIGCKKANEYTLNTSGVQLLHDKSTFDTNSMQIYECQEWW